jgi:hypothetical protein
MRFLPTSAVIRKIVIVTDNDKPISPGLLCREFIFSLAQPDTPIVLASNDNSIISKFTISSIHPYPYAYRYQTRDTLSEFALRLSHKVKTIDNTLHTGAKLLFDKATEALHLDKLTKLHPLQFAAAVLFSNGEMEVAWQLKGMEYGCTLDPVVQLIREMEKRRFCRPCVTTNMRKRKLQEDNDDDDDDNHDDNNSGRRINTDTTTESSITSTVESEQFIVAPTLLLLIDQHGLAHAPFAQARALLTEHGYGDLSIIVHDCESLQPVLVRAAELTPEPPSGGKLLCQDDF